eukprot:Nitzschia sp. Nitz4//scaffold11_size288233//187947//192366//NITZ4_000795-RA/size288233-processed-gene-0.450-mRNA-1//1//CDS//3329534137//4979//frame0
MTPNIASNTMDEQEVLLQSNGSYGTLSDSAEIKKPALWKTQGTFLEDAMEFKEGTIPHSTVVAFVIGTVCGISAFVYYTFLEWALEFFWHTLPEKVVVDVWPEWAYVLWIPLVGFSMAIGVGLTVVYLGEPGDLPYTIKCVHDTAFVSMDHVMPMFSIIGGGSLGPEAPLVAICAAVGGYISRKVFHQTDRNLVRKHTLMGMGGALAAFFGCPLGGSLFALEVNSRFGIEYFEHTIEAIFAGEVCLVVFRALAGLPISAIWEITLPRLENSEPLAIFHGALLGLAGSLVAYLFAKMHRAIMQKFDDLGLICDERAVPRALLGSVFVVILGMIIPHTMFWGEYEFDTIATMGPASSLTHIWPTHGLLNFEMDNWWKAVIVGVAKLVAVSFTVSGGYRGGYIFPAMAAGAAFGRAIHFLCPFIPVQLCVLCMAGAITVAITRTSIATTLILAYLSGEQNSLSAVLASCLVALFVTGYMPFIGTQVARADMSFSVYRSTQEEIDIASNKFAAITAAYSLLSDPLRKRQYDHIYKYGGYDEEPAASPENPTPAEKRSKSPMPGQRGIGYSFTNPISYVLSNGKVKSQTVAGISFPTRGQMACGGGGGFQVSFSSGQAEESDSGSVRCKSHTVQFSKGKKYNRVETTNIHRDGRKEVIIEGDDFIERRFSTAPIRNRPNRNARGHEKEARDDGLASTTDEVPWHDKLLKDLKDVTSNPKNADYEMENGGTRNYEVYKDKAKTEEESALEKKEEEKLDAMKALENRVLDSQREMADLDNLEEIRAMNKRHIQLLAATGDSFDAEAKALVAARHSKEKPLSEDVKLNENGITEEEESLVKSIKFGQATQGEAVLRLNEEDEKKEDERRRNEVRKIQAHQQSLAQSSRVTAAPIPLVKVKRKRTTPAQTEEVKKPKSEPSPPEPSGGVESLLGGYGSSDSD